MQANYGATEINSLLSKVRIFNREIGTYEVFAITDSFDYAVKLSNGRINIKIEELQDDERDALTPERLTAIANRFVSSTAKTKTTQAQPVPTPQVSVKQDTPKKKSKVGRTILIIVIVLAAIFGGLAVYDNMNRGGGYGTGGNSYQEKVMTVEEIERSQPTNFLTADGNYNESFWGDKIKVHGVIKNKATVATYKDAVVRVTYYSKTKTELGSKEYTIYETFPPHSEVKFELKIENYKDVSTIGWDVIQATAN